MLKFFIAIILICCLHTADAQELNARVTVVANRVNNTVNRNTFTTLQAALNSFLNTRRWTSDVFDPSEKIDCNFLLNIESTEQPNVYKAFLNIQAARPIFNTSYQSPIVNFKDDDVAFKYIEFQQLEYNENRITGNDPLISNLTAVFAYYANLILALDYNSFGLHAGDAYYLKAQNIVNNAPQGAAIIGWRSFDGLRNRYWLMENAVNPRYKMIHDIYYNYYRLGLDKMYEDENKARIELLNVVNQLDLFNVESPNTMINAFFLQGKATEIIKIFSKASPPDKSRVREIMAKYDIANSAKYNEELK